LVDLICTEEGDFDIYVGYSGRGMFGKKSIFAFTSQIHPNSILGIQLTQKGNLAWDNMGMGFIYYSTTTT
jgi:hypothetical protein